MTWLANVARTGSATTATSVTAPVGHAVSVGDTVVVIAFTHGICTIDELSDSKGNTWTVIDHTDTGAYDGDAKAWRSTLTAALTTSDHFTVTGTAGSWDGITVWADSFAGEVVPEGAPTFIIAANSNTQKQGVISTQAATLYAWFAHTEANATSATVSGTDWAQTASFVTATNPSSAVAAYREAAGAMNGGNCTVTWSTSHSGITLGLSLAAPGAGPHADAGADQFVPAGTVVQLDGTGSTGTDLTHAWTHVSGPSSVAALSDPSLAQPTYTPVTSGTDVWQDAVTDANGLTSSDTVTITADNRAPVAIAADQSVAAGSVVTLNGSGSYDLDVGDTLSYAWTRISGPNGSDLSSATAASPTYTARNSGTDVWQLVVTDNHGAASDPVTCTITVGGSGGVRMLIGGQWNLATVKLLVGGTWVDV